MIQSLEKWKNVLNYSTVKPHTTLNNSLNSYLKKITCDHKAILTLTGRLNSEVRQY